MSSFEITTEGIKKTLKSMGASLVGVADTSFLKRTYGLKRKDLKKYPRAISIGVQLADTIIVDISEGPTLEYAQHYRDKNEELDNLAFNLAEELKAKGHRAMAIHASKNFNYSDLAAIFPHKTAAILSGLGWIGRSVLLISHELGPRVRFSTVLTDAPLAVDDPQTTSECGSCTACVQACPVGAIKGKLWTFGIERKEIFDAYKCHAHLEIQKQEVGETICGICVNVCPYGQKKN